MSCLTEEGMYLPQAARWESEIYGELFKHFAGQNIPKANTLVAAGLTGAANLARALEEIKGPERVNDIRRILGGHYVPFKEIVPRSEDIIKLFNVSVQRNREAKLETKTIAVPERPKALQLPMALMQHIFALWKSKRSYVVWKLK